MYTWKVHEKFRKRRQKFALVIYELSHIDVHQ